MAFFIGLIIWYIIFWLLSLLHVGVFEGMYQQGTLAAAAMFVLVGISHFIKKEKLLAMIPPQWRFRNEMNYLSGGLEIILGILLCFPDYRMSAAYGLMILLLAIFPANIYVAKTKPNAYNISRLFFQPMYMLWLWYFCIHPTLCTHCPA